MNNAKDAGDRAVLVRESWARRVTNATQLTERAAISAGEMGKPQYSLSRFYDIRPAVLKSAWGANASGIYQATAAFLNSATGAVDNSFIFPVTAPANTTAPEGTVEETRFFVIWRGRWEMIPATAGGGQAVNYVGGLGIDVGAYDATLGGRPISNTGTLFAWIQGDTYESGRVLEISAADFKWVDSSVFIGGKKLKAKTRRLNVVTNIESGQPVRETIKVFDES